MKEAEGDTPYRQMLRDRILDAAMGLFMSKGVRAVRMDDIANALSISKRTLYEAFSDKETLLHEGIRKYHELKRARTVAYASRNADIMDIIMYVYKTSIEQFKVINPLFFSDMDRYPRIQRYFKNENDAYRRQFIAFLERGIGEGYFRSDLNLELVMNLFDALGHYFKSDKLYEEYSIEDIFFNIVLVSLRGMCTGAGLRALDAAIERYNLIPLSARRGE